MLFKPTRLSVNNTEIQKTDGNALIRVICSFILWINLYAVHIIYIMCRIFIVNEDETNKK